MQAFDPTKLCSGVTSGSLTDSRGETTKTYTVAKLADNKWWMTTNLDLPGKTTVTSSDSNVTSNYTLPASSTSGFSDDSTAYVYNSGSTSCNSGPCYSYYSYVAATAGTGASNTSLGYNASGSICPKGWRLPTATTSYANPQANNNWKTGDFYALATAYGANLTSSYSENSGTFYSKAGPGTTPNFLIARYYYNDQFIAGGSDGYYWSATSRNSRYAFYLTFTSSSVNSAEYYSRSEGLSIRCVYAS